MADRKDKENYACPRCSEKLRYSAVATAGGRTDGLREHAEEHSDSLACAGCDSQYPVVAGIPILVNRPNALLLDMTASLKGAVARMAATAARLNATAIQLEEREPTPGSKLAPRVKKFQRGMNSNLALVENFWQPVEHYLASQVPSQPSLLDWVSTQAGGWTALSMLPYFYQDWAGTKAFERVQRLVIQAVREHCTARGTALILGAGACGIAYAVAEEFDESHAVDLSVPTLLLANAVLAGEPLLVHLEKAEWQAVKIAPPGNRANLTLVAANVRTLPFADKSQSLVVSQYLMDLVADPLGVADEIRRVLQSGGIWINFSNPLSLPEEPEEVGAPAIEEICERFCERGFETRLARIERFTLNSVEELSNRGIRANQEVHFFVLERDDLRPVPATAGPENWFQGDTWADWIPKKVPGRNLQIVRQRTGKNSKERTVVRMGTRELPLAQGHAEALETLLAGLNGERRAGALQQYLKVNGVLLSQSDLRELLHYLRDHFKLLQ